MMTSVDVFFIFFFKFWFCGLFGFGGEGVKKAKIWYKMTKNSVSLRISRTVPHMIVVFGTHV